MESRCLVWKMFGQVVGTKLIKGKLAISWKGLIQGNFFLDHFSRHWFMIEFTNKEDVAVVLEGRPWYVKGQIFHVEKWTPNFCDLDEIHTIKPWIRVPRLAIQFKEAKIVKNLVEVIGKVIKVDKVTLHGLNGLFVLVLMEDNGPIYVSYEKLFEVCFYCGGIRLDGHRCPIGLKNSRPLFLIEMMFKKEPKVFPTSVMDVTSWNEEMQEDVTIYFPQVTLFKDDHVDPGQGSAREAEPESEG
ncbi:hypothetical protein D8674_003747 [Pyrus ussuriensis x Pyrus communis]|uniref:DUF4283 domain-containing protein n=1 Tax=Pyrus ussuriensis x Pyrus communis TaxID=2448454 RepID=A0A5N5FNE5_9ROSA|nr:hypothetical protein D8674_003747 [Pyrus ussuriensis x Pyrus communis]